METTTRSTQPTVLVVDDSRRVRALVVSLLQDFAGLVVECDDGREAVSSYEAVRPDWVVMDLAMEGMDGLTATTMIRQLDPNARIVIVTDHDEPDMRAAVAAAGGAGFIGKDELVRLPALLRELSVDAASGAISA